MWMVRAGRDSVYVEDFLEKGIVSLGWSDLGPVNASSSRNEVVEHYLRTYPEHSNAQAQAGVNQILRFVKEIKVGDDVVTYDRDKRVYYLGKIVGEPTWSNLIENMERSRRVTWTHQIPRDRLNPATKNTLGAIMTLFKLNQSVTADLQNSAVEINAKISVADEAPLVESQRIEEVQQEQEITEELLARTETTIEERIARLDWESLQELVAGILRAMNYRTTVSPRGADRGVDIFASPDGLGLEEPRIFVEVKHRINTSIDAQQIRSFLGGRSVGDRCLYVSTGGFTKDARYEAERANVAIRLITLTDLRRLLVDYYDSIDEKTRNLVPLRRAYIPI